MAGAKLKCYVKIKFRPVLFKRGSDIPRSMTLLHLFFLSLVQGLTEFLPVSSSGHLALFPRIFGEADQGILIDVALHIGTLLAILIYYRRDILNIVLAIVTWHPARVKDRNLGLLIALGSVPTFIVGIIIHVLFPEGIRSVAVITFNMVAFAVLMGFADKKGAQEKTVHDISVKGALLAGLAQSIALIPGVSRSGITMTAARFMGFKRTEAARFSFLLGIPAMAAAGAMSLLEIAQADNPGLWHDAAIAVALSFAAGLAAIHFMMRWLRNAGLMPFVVYRLALGVFLFFYLIV